MAPQLGHAIRLYAEMRSRTARDDMAALQESMHAVVDWLTEAKITISTTQRRAGWPWLVKQAECGRSLTLAEQVHGARCWPVPEPRVDGDHRLLVIGSFAALMEEGQAMHHCAFDYRFDCAMDKAIVVSIRHAQDGHRVATARYERACNLQAAGDEWQPRPWKLWQVRSVLNQDSPASAVRAARRAEEWLNAWSATLEPPLGIDIAASVEEHWARVRAAEVGDGSAGLAADAGPPSSDEGTSIDRHCGVRPLVWFSREYGSTLVRDDFDEPTRNAQVFSSVRVERLRTAEDVVDLANGFNRVARVLGELLENDRDVLQEDLVRGQLSSRRRASLLAALEAINDEEAEYGLADWLAYRGQPGLEACRRSVAAWLRQAPDAEDWELFDSAAGSAQGAAKAWFERLDYDDLRQLGIRIVEGDHPGSSYYAAELHGSAEAANEAARTLGLRCRFRTRRGAYSSAWDLRSHLPHRP